MGRTRPGWRGHDHTARVFCDLVTKILDGEDPGGGFNLEPWHSLRRRLLGLRDPTVPPKTEPTCPPGYHFVQRIDGVYTCLCGEYRVAPQTAP